MPVSPSLVKSIVALGFTAAICGSAVADTVTPVSVSVTLPEEFMTGRAPVGFEGITPPAEGFSANDIEGDETEGIEGAERQREGGQAVNGTLYTVVAPIFDGSDGNVSYIRFPNGSGATAVTSVTVVGSPSGDIYGTFDLTVQNLASPQYSIGDILNLAGAPALSNGDDNYSLYLRSPSAGNYVGFQHVIYNASNGFFENVSVCTFDPLIEYSAINRSLINIHTSVLAAYPATVFVHNYLNAPVTYTAAITDARTGNIEGFVDISMAANGSYAVPFTFFEDLIDWTPASNQQHANMIFQQSSTVGYYAVVGQAIQNSAFNSLVNMTQTCGLNN